MGAEPARHTSCSGFRRTSATREVMELVNGAETLAGKLGVTICGGDLTASNELFVSVTASVTPRTRAG